MHMGERIREERERLGFNQSDFAALGSATRKTLFNWETGAAAPSAVVLAAWAKHGLDVLYVVTGQRGGAVATPRLSADEQELLALFRAAPLAVKAAAIGALQGGAASTGAGVRQISTGAGAVQVAHAGGDVAIGAPIGKSSRKRSG